MANLSKNLILETASELVKQKQTIKISLSDVGKALSVSHAALYKYFPNKKALWTELALNWLDVQLAALFPFNTSSYSTTAAIAHDWLWTLASGKREAMRKYPDMFALYTTYIGQDQEAYTRHTQKLGYSFMEATGKEEAFTIGILTSFIYFSAPEYSKSWNKDFQMEFELVWQIVKSAFEE